MLPVAATFGHARQFQWRRLESVPAEERCDGPPWLARLGEDAAAKAAVRQRRSSCLRSNDDDRALHLCPSVAAAAVGPRAAHHRPRLVVRQHRRAHQRHRLQGLRAADPGWPVRASPRGGAPAGRERRPGHRRQHGRSDARQPGRDGALSATDGRRTRDRARAGDDRQFQVERHRGRPAVHPGQGHRQLDLAEGRRGRVPAPGDAGAPLRRCRGGDGLRRTGPGRHLPAQDRHLRARLPHPDGRGRLPGRRHHLRPQHLRDRHRHRGARQLRGRLHRGHALDQGEPAGCEGRRAASPT